MKILLRGPFDLFSGYGRDCVEIALALDRAGFQVVPWPTSLMPGLPRRFTELLQPDPRGRGDMLLQFSPPWDMHDPGDVADLRVGWTMWERAPFLPADMNAGGGPGSLRWLDRLLVSCEMNVEAFAAWHGRIDVVPSGVDTGAWPQVHRVPFDRPLRFLMVGMLAGRKDPWTALDAWRAAKNTRPDFDATFRLHTLCPGLHPQIGEAIPGVEITQKPLSHPEMVGMYQQADVLVSTSRGEGNNKPAMEMLATGGAAAASDWSGHRNWLNPAVSWALPGEVMTAGGAAREFRVDRAGVQGMLLEAHDDREGLARRQRTAGGYARAALTWDHAVGRLRTVLGI